MFSFYFGNNSQFKKLHIKPVAFGNSSIILLLAETNEHINHLCVIYFACAFFQMQLSDNAASQPVKIDCLYSGASVRLH